VTVTVKARPGLDDNVIEVTRRIPGKFMRLRRGSVYGKLTADTVRMVRIERVAALALALKLASALAAVVIIESSDIRSLTHARKFACISPSAAS
jgi:hypothetical protein